MTANFAIQNNTNNPSHGRQETLRKLAKHVIKNASQKERDVKFVIENRKEYITKQYIPAEVVIYNISAQTCQTSTLKEKLNFLNNKAAIKNLTTAPKKIYNPADEDSNELLSLELDDSNNIFAA